MLYILRSPVVIWLREKFLIMTLKGVAQINLQSPWEKDVEEGGKKTACLNKWHSEVRRRKAAAESRYVISHFLERGSWTLGSADGATNCTGQQIRNQVYSLFYISVHKRFFPSNKASEDSRMKMILNTPIHWKWLMSERFNIHKMLIEQFRVNVLPVYNSTTKQACFLYTLFSTFGQMLLSWKLPFVQNKNGSTFWVQLKNVLKKFVFSFLVIQCFSFFFFFSFHDWLSTKVWTIIWFFPHLF